jgi:hypothetical protein
LRVFSDLLLRPSEAFERIRENENALMPIFFLTAIGILGLLNEAALLYKVVIAEIPPMGLQAPPLALRLSTQIPTLMYGYYFVQSVIFAFLIALFNLGTVLVVGALAARNRKTETDVKSLFVFSFFSLAPMLITGLISLLIGLLKPEAVVFSTLNTSPYMARLSRNSYYVAWEVVGWAGELWSAGLTAYSTKLTHSFNGSTLLVVIALVLALTVLRMYFVF